MLRLPHGSIHTAHASGAWIVRFVRCHGLRSRTHLSPAEPKLDASLTARAVHGIVAAATQTQAMPALVCLDRRGLTHTLAGRQADHGPRGQEPRRGRRRPRAQGRTAQLVATLLDGSGVRLREAARLRGKGIDGQMKPLPVRSGTGGKARCTTSPAMRTPVLQNHLAGVRTLHQQDLARGHSAVYRPHALARKVPPAPRHGAGRMPSRPGTSLSPLALASPAVIVWSPASSTTPSRGRSAAPV